VGEKENKRELTYCNFVAIDGVIKNQSNDGCSFFGFIICPGRGLRPAENALQTCSHPSYGTRSDSRV
jgi:hypothetical protein